MSLILVLLIVLGFAWYVMTPEQRTWAINAMLPAVARLKDAALRKRAQRDSYHDMLRTRTRWAIVMPAIAGANLGIFALMLFGRGTLSDPETLIGWGGNFGPHTTNGEWWRLVAATFIQSGLLALVANIIGMLRPGLLIERLMGPLTVAAVYVAAGLFAGLVHLSTHPVSVAVGASAGIFSIYGLLLGSMLWLLLQRSPLAIPFATIKALVPSVGVFILYHTVTDGLVTTSAVVGLATGFAAGMVLGKNLSDDKPPVRRIAAFAAGCLAIAMAFAVPLRGLADVRPEIEHVAAVEDHTATAYETALLRFRNGRISAEALADFIDRTIMPELQAARARLESLRGVPQEHQQLVASAETYLQLRDESWRLRAEGLRKTNMRTLHEADKTERASLEALQKMKPSTW